MRHIVETGTDGATLCFFDPKALPTDFDEQIEKGTIEVFDQLQKDGRFWWKQTDGDGGYLFHFYVDEPVPEQILSHSFDPQRMDRFQISGGTVWACGAEYAAQDPLGGHKSTPKGGLGRFSGMGGCFSLPPGEYAVTAWRTEWPEGMLEAELEKRLGKAAVGRVSVLGKLTGFSILLSIVGAIVVLGLTISSTRPKSLPWIWVALFLFWFVTYRLLKWTAKAEKDSGKLEVERGFPSIVVHLCRLD